MRLRGGRSRFVVESKLFEIVVESGGKLKGCIWERSRGFASWIRFGEASLRCLLEGVETCCREVDDHRWAIEWEGSGQWMELFGCEVERSWSDTVRRIKVHQCARGSVEAEGSPKGSVEGKGVEMKSFAEAVKSTPRRAGESVWLEVREKEVRGRLEQLKHCLIGRWGSISAPLLELDYVRIWTRQNREVKGKLSIAVLGRGIMLFEFEQAQEAERVLARGKRSIKENWLILEKWNPEVFKSIGDGCGGFIAVDEGTKSMFEMQWARILVKHADWEVVPGGKLLREGRAKGRRRVVGSHRVACCGSQRKGVEQLGLQVEVQDVARNGGKLLIPSDEALQKRLLRGDGLVVQPT
ncbi:hypothetical protein CK203_109632 [Vitis vinifera]|uniref:DUF4283 domain-containing protein n=1 Tax=Vitis vinifera TaxID=29760 RepID=A0A438EB53_VITVI|nr:hypothetical protein CK203_109632 [Vitis vinifera]